MPQKGGNRPSLFDLPNETTGLHVELLADQVGADAALRRARRKRADVTPLLLLDAPPLGCHGSRYGDGQHAHVPCPLDNRASSAMIAALVARF